MSEHGGHDFRRVFRVLTRKRSDIASDVDEEMRIHIALRVDQLMAEGRSREDAEAEAHRLFASGEGTVRALHALARERDRRFHARESWQSWLQDLRYAIRGLVRSPSLSGFAVLTLALGIGLNLASFSVLDRLLLRDPPHVIEPDQLLRVYSTVELPSVGAQTSYWIPWPLYQSLRAGVTGFGAIGAYRVQERVVGEGMDARRMRVGQTTGAYLSLLGARPVRGRLFGREDDAGRVGPQALIGAAYWESHFGRDPAVLGRTLVVDETAYTIVGVMPAGFTGTELRRVDVWVLADSRSAGNMNWQIVGRIRPGTTGAGVDAELMAIHAGTEAEPDWFRSARVFAASVRSAEDGREPFEAVLARWLAVVSGVILLVAIANVVSLLLARLARRRRELAVRIALGSGRARVVRLLSLEGAVLVAASGVVSVAVASVSESLVRNALFADEVAWTFSLFDVQMTAALLATVLATALVVGLAPALRAGRDQPSGVLRAGPHGGHTRVRGALTVFQAAMSVLLLIGAGLFLRSLERVAALDLGVDRDRVIVASAELPRPTVFTVDAFAEYDRHETEVFRRLASAARRVPGVEAAAVAVGLPLDGGSIAASVHVAGMDSVPALPGGGPYASVVSAGYFETAGTSLLRGRAFTEADREGSEPVIVVSETMAARLWPGRSALNQCVRIGRPDNPCYRVVGVVKDVHRVGLREQPSLQYYIPLGQQSMFGGASLIVREAESGAVGWPGLRRALMDEEPTIRVVGLTWLRDALDGEMRPLRLGMVTFGLSGGLALLVAVLGLYSLMSYMVAWRTREIGIRLAIGATSGQITRLVIRSGTALVAMGVAIGLAIAVWSARFVEPHLFETRALDPAVFLTVAIVLLIVAILAGWLPARRAVAISPTEALRTE